MILVRSHGIHTKTELVLINEVSQV